MSEKGRDEGERIEETARTETAQEGAPEAPSTASEMRTEEAQAGEAPPPERPQAESAEAEPAAAPAQAPPPRAEKKSGGGGAWFVAFLALFLTLGVAGAAGWFWWMDQQRQQALEARLAQLDQRLSETPWAAELEALAARVQTLDALRDLETQVRQEVDRLAQAQQASEARLQAALERLYQRMGRSSVDWILAEAEYLLRLANARLQLAQDPDTAIAALRAADERLASLDDPALQPVRAAIAEEIAALEGLPRVDRAGLAARLDALANQAEQLPLARRYLPPEPENPLAEAPPELSADEPWWEQAWTRLAETLKSLVVVRYNEQPVAPVLAPEQVTALRTALMMELEMARVAVVRGDEALYREALRRAGDLVRRYFDGEAAATGALLQALEDLAATSIQVQYPDLSTSLRRLREAKTLLGSADDGGEGGS